MSDDRKNSFQADHETQITLNLLTAIHENSAITQRSVAKELGIALGLANSYLKRCVKKGLVKVTQAPANRYAYYLTPKGFAEKSQLTAQYLKISFNFLRHARDHCNDVFEACKKMGMSKIVLVGASELAEIAILCSKGQRIDIVGIVDEAFEEETFSDLPVYRSLNDVERFDAVVIADVTKPQALFDSLSGQFPEVFISAPRLLNVSRNGVRSL